MSPTHLAVVPSPGVQAEFYRLRELAGAWRVSEALLRKEIRKGSLAAVRIGRVVLVSKGDAANFLERQRTRGGRP